MEQKIKMISLDTSSTKTGWAYFENGKYVESNVINLNDREYQKKYKDNSDKRIEDMCLHIIDLLKNYEPNIIVLEKLNVGRNMVAVRCLSKIIGVVYCYSILNNCFYYEIQASQWRSQIGIQGKNRKRDEYKKLAIEYVKNALDIEVTDDEADSICVGIGYIKMFI